MNEFNQETMEHNNVTQEPQIDPNCTCNDRYKLSPCPVHYKPPMTKNVNEFGQQSIIVTDNNLISDQYILWQGFVFQCPVCRKPSIMVNPTMGKFCCNCGIKIEVQSDFITKLVKKLESEYRR